MSAGAPWSVKGIDPKAREIAKDLARRSGMTLGEWLNQMILEDAAAVDEPPAPQALSPKPVYIGPERRARPRDGSSESEAALARVSRALEGLTERIEAAEHRSTQAIGGVDRAVTGLLGRIDLTERGQKAATLKLERTAHELRANQASLAERLRKFERENGGPRSIQALKALEAAMGKLAGQLYEGDSRNRDVLTALEGRVGELEGQPTADVLVEGLVARIAERLELAESRTSDAIRALEGSFTSLDQRLNQAETRLDVGTGTRFEALAEDLSRRVDAARNELAHGLGGAVSGRFDRIERTLEDLTGHVEAAEKRSAEAIEHMGHEVVRIARNLDARMTGVETASQRGLAETRGELARIAEAAEQRFRQAETGHAQALERLGQEIGRISAQMSERLIEADRRAISFAEDAGAKLERTAGLWEAQWNKASSDLSDRIRESEERTARLIEETKVKIDQALAHPAAAVDALFEPAREAPQLASGWAAEPAAPELEVHHDAHHGEAEALFDEAAEFEPEPELHAESEAGPAEWAPALEASDDEHSGDDIFSADTEFVSGQEGGDGEPPILSTRAALEAARNAARSNARPNRDDHAFGFGLGGLKLGTKTKLSERVAKESKRDPSLAKTVALSSACAVVLVSSIVGYRMILSGGGQPAWTPQPSKKPTQGPMKIVEPDTTPALKTQAPAPATEPPTPDEIAAQAPSTQPPAPTPAATTSAAAPRTLASRAAATPAAGRTSTAAPLASPMAAIALTTSSAPPPRPAADLDAVKLYNLAQQKLDAKEPGGVALLTKAANLGYAPAQFQLGKFLEDGEAGLTKDAGSARRWTERAANGGDKRAMYNLATYYIEGIGGPKDLIEAAGWFRKAAMAGVVDSQYNLARLYEQGYGVDRDPVEAYKWYLVAAKAGDKESKSAAETIRSTLSADDAKRAEQAALAIHAGAHDGAGRVADR
jgi:localization factor PodJL